MAKSSTDSKSTESVVDNLISEKHLWGSIQVKSEIPNSSTCLSVRFNPAGKAYGVALADGFANVYLSETDRLIYTVNNNSKPNKIHHYSATSIRFRPWGIENLNQNNLVLVTFTNGKVKTFHFPTGECVNTLREEREIITSDYSPRGDTFATAGDDGKLIIYDDETRARLVTYEPPYYEKREFRRIYSIAYHPQATDELITGGWDGIVRYYDIRIPHMIKQFYGPYVCGEGLALDPSGKEICSASWRHDKALQLWDYGSGSLIKTIPLSDEILGDPDVATVSSTTGLIKSNNNRRPRTSISSLPPIRSDSSKGRRKSFCAKEPAKKPKLPRMLYSCRYYINGDFLVFSGSNRNSVAVINKNNNKVLAAINNLGHSVYCIDTYRSRIALIAGNHVAVVKLDKTFIQKFL